MSQKPCTLDSQKTTHFCKIPTPFLKIGQTFARFHSVGMDDSFSERLKSQ